MRRRPRCPHSGRRPQDRLGDPQGSKRDQLPTPHLITGSGQREVLMQPIGDPGAFADELLPVVDEQPEFILRPVGTHRWKPLLASGNSCDSPRASAGSDFPLGRTCLRSAAVRLAGTSITRSPQASRNCATGAPWLPNPSIGQIIVGPQLRPRSASRLQAGAIHAWTYAPTNPCSMAKRVARAVGYLEFAVDVLEPRRGRSTWRRRTRNAPMTRALRPQDVFPPSRSRLWRTRSEPPPRAGVRSRESERPRHYRQLRRSGAPGPAHR
jgi:hypothetical protein